MFIVINFKGNAAKEKLGKYAERSFNVIESCLSVYDEETAELYTQGIGEQTKVRLSLTFPMFY